MRTIIALSLLSTNWRHYPLAIIDSTLSGNGSNDGGGVFNFDTGVLTIENTTLSGNRADYGGGVANSGRLTISNSTLSGNRAFGYYGDAGSGGGVQNFGTLRLAWTVISGNVALTNPEVENYSPGDITADNFNLFGHNGNAGVSDFAPGPRDIVPTVPLNAILTPTSPATADPLFRMP